MVSQCSSGVQAFILVKVRTRTHAVDNITGVLNKHISLSYE